MKTQITPIVKLKSSRFAHKNIWVKLEYFQDGGTIKMRVATEAIKQAERIGALAPFKGNTIIEASGGSMGVSLAILAARRGYKLKLVLPDNYNLERIRQLPVYGAEVLLSDHTLGNDSHFKMAATIQRIPGHYYVDQLNNPANPLAHYLTTGKEIIRQLKSPDYFVSVVGSGGTLSGTGTRIREAYPDVKIVAVQPEGCDILKGTAIVHKIQGTAVGLIPGVFSREIVDEVISINYEEAMELGHYLVRKEGLFLGISACANVLAAEKLSEQVGYDKRIITMAPDGGQIYLSNYLNQKNAHYGNY